MANFLELSGIPLKVEDLTSVPPTRVSLHRRKVAFLAQLDKSNKPAFRKVRKLVADSDVIAEDGCKYLMSPEDRAKFLEKYAASNLSLCERYGNDWAPYLTTPTPDKNWFPAAPTSDAELSELTKIAEAAGIGSELRLVLAGGR